jgi:hypothetical protein
VGDDGAEECQLLKDYANDPERSYEVNDEHNAVGIQQREATSNPNHEIPGLLPSCAK